MCAGSCLHCHTPPTCARAIPSGWGPERPGPPWSAALERRDRLEPKLRCGRSPPPPRNGNTLPHARTYEGTLVSEQLSPAAGRSSFRVSPRSGPLPSRACGQHRPVELTFPTEKNRPEAGLPAAGGRSSLHAHRMPLQFAPARLCSVKWAWGPFFSRIFPHAIYSVCSAGFRLPFVNWPISLLMLTRLHLQQASSPCCSSSNVLFSKS